MSNTIVLNSVGTLHLKEAPANGAISPGDFLSRATDGDFQRQATASINGPKLIAVENDLVAGTITDDYATGDNVRATYLKSGDEVYAFVAASAAAIVIGDVLEFDGVGGVKKGASGVTVATALEAVDNSGGGAKARIRIELI